MRGFLASRRWGYGAAAWAAAFAVVHLFWAWGGHVGLAESAGRELAQDRTAWFVALGLLGVALLLLAAAAVGVLLARGPLGSRTGRLLRLCGFGIAAVLLLRAIGVEALLLTDAGYGGGAISHAQRFWTLVLWNPWFLLGGILFGVAAQAGRRPHRTAADPTS